MKAASDSPGMTISLDTLDGDAPIVVLRAFVAGLLFVIVLAIVVADEHQPHIELAPPPISTAMPAIPVASGAVGPGWRS
jgi:hypothetical protein